MELSWLMRLRIGAAMAVGTILIGILGWPLAAPPEPFAVVSLFAGTVSSGGAITLAILAFLAGFIAYFLSWPYGREIGILAAPFGLAIWAARSGSIAGLMQQNATLAQRQALFAALRWEPVFWLGIVTAGFAGVVVGQKIRRSIQADRPAEKSNSKQSIYLSAIIALIATVFSILIAQFCIRIFAQDVRSGSVVSQPAIGQVIFAVIVSFGVAAFIVKQFLDASYIWPTISCALVTSFAVSIYVKRDVLQHLTQHWPAVFFSNAVVCILPVQMVAFGTLGSIAGYWLAVRYNYWRKHT